MWRPIHQAFQILLLILSTSAFADIDGPMPPRPNIADYTDQSRFVADVLAWEKLRTERDTHPHRSPSGAKAKEHDWHHVTGPEDLDKALENAEGYQQPNYREPIRYNRTTHLSFPLKKLPPEQMAVEHAEEEGPAPLGYTPSELERLPETVIEQLDQLQRYSATQEPSPTNIRSLAERTN